MPIHTPATIADHAIRIDAGLICSPRTLRHAQS